MLHFFSHKNFWLPLILFSVLLIVTELLLRAGLYNNLLSPDSLMKRSIDRKLAMQAFGLENINWITLGDSRTDWGLEHHRIQDQQIKQKLNHVRLSFGRSAFPTYQALSNWSLDNLPNLQGVLIGMPMSNFTQKPNPYNQETIVWAFKDYLPINYSNQKPVNEWTPFLNLYNKTYLSHYLPDIKDLTGNLSARLRRYKTHTPKDQSELFTTNFKAEQDLCDYQLNTLESCQLSAHNLINKINPSNVEQNIINRCHENAKTKQLDELEIATFVEQWLNFFQQYLDENKTVAIMLYPQHPIFDYLINPQGTEIVYQRILQSLVDKPNFKVIDLRQVFSKENVAPCSVYTDMVHFNVTGRKYVSNALIEEIQRKPLN